MTACQPVTAAFKYLTEQLEIQTPKVGKKKKKFMRPVIETGATLDATHIKDCVSAATNNFIGTEQQDADEFLMAFINTMNSELQQMMESKQTFVSSSIFGVTSKYNTTDSNTEGPDVEKFVSLRCFINKSYIVDVPSALKYTFRDGQKSGHTVFRNRISTLPAILIITLNRFNYCNKTGLYKDLRNIKIESTLNIPVEILSDQAALLNSSKRKYKLQAVIYHEGYCLNSGHYTSDVFKGTNWMHFNDGNVSSCSAPEQRNAQESKTPYVLIYQRKDTFSSARKSMH